MKLTYIALTLYSLGYALLFGTWAVVVFNKVPGSEQLISYIQVTLGALTGHILTMLNPGRVGDTAPTASASPQGGFASPILLGALALGAAMLLSGCAGFQQVATGYESSAIKGIQATEDNNIRMWAANACGTPFSAAIRNPQVVPALKALCLPAGAASNPSTLLDAVPAAMKGAQP